VSLAPKDGEDLASGPVIRPAPDAVAPGAVPPPPGVAGYLTLCAGCGVPVRLTDAQAVIAEAELIALDVVTMAFCRRCQGSGAPTR
jgi:hypothetical protein